MTTPVTIKQIMSTQVATIEPACPIEDAVTLMREKNYSCLIVTEDKKPLGIITERDILKLTNLLLESGQPKKVLHAKSLMTSPVTSVRESTNLVSVISLCKEQKNRHLPVIDDKGLLTGILTQSDLVNAYICQLENQNAQAANVVTHSSSEVGDGIPEVNLDDLEKDLKQVFISLQTNKNPSGSARLQPRLN